MNLCGAEAPDLADVFVTTAFHCAVRVNSPQSLQTALMMFSSLLAQAVMATVAGLPASCRRRRNALIIRSRCDDGGETECAARQRGRPRHAVCRMRGPNRRPAVPALPMPRSGARRDGRVPATARVAPPSLLARSRASFHSTERIAPSNSGIKHLNRAFEFG